MYAVIETGGKQYKVAPGKCITVEKLAAEVGSSVEFTKTVLLKTEHFKVGTPYVPGVTVKAEVLTQHRGEKIEIIKFRRRKHHQKRTGHRQYYTGVKILDIVEDSTDGT